MRSLQFFLFNRVFDGEIVVITVCMDFFMLNANLIF